MQWEKQAWDIKAILVLNPTEHRLDCIWKDDILFLYKGSAIIGVQCSIQYCEFNSIISSSIPSSASTSLITIESYSKQLELGNFGITKSCMPLIYV